ncbi:MAG TPA: DNA-binding protein [Rhodanobacter sp.]|nr:DNA-binding protein [Rhodanobacter sp.]
MRERIAGRIHPYRIGQRIIRYTDAILNEYLESCRNVSEKSVTTGSPNGQAPRNGAERGTTPTLGRRDAHHLAQTIFKRPK